MFYLTFCSGVVPLQVVSVKILNFIIFILHQVFIKYELKEFSIFCIIYKTFSFENYFDNLKQ